MPNRTPSTPANPGPSLARVTVASHGWTIDTRGLLAARAYHFACEGETAEFARILRDEGGWPLRFGPGAEGIECAIAKMDEDAAA